MDYNDTTHAIDEFKDFPWHQMDATWMRTVGGIGRDNHGNAVITFHREDASMDKWHVPQEMVSLCENYRRNGANNVRTALTRMLEIERYPQ